MLHRRSYFFFHFQMAREIDNDATKQAALVFGFVQTWMLFVRPRKQVHSLTIYWQYVDIYFFLKKNLPINLKHFITKSLLGDTKRLNHIGCASVHNTLDVLCSSAAASSKVNEINKVVNTRIFMRYTKQMTLFVVCTCISIERAEKKNRAVHFQDHNLLLNAN